MDKDTYLLNKSPYEVRCILFGYYVAYWNSPLGIQDGHFTKMFDVLTFFGLPWNLKLSWVIYKHYKLIGRSATYQGV